MVITFFGLPPFHLDEMTVRRNREWMDPLVTIGKVYSWIVGGWMSIRVGEWCFPSLWLTIGLHNPWFAYRLFAGIAAATYMCWEMHELIMKFVVGFANEQMKMGKYLQGREGGLFLNVWMCGLASSLLNGLSGGAVFRVVNELLGAFGWVVGWEWKVLVVYCVGGLCCRFWGWFEGFLVGGLGSLAFGGASGHSVNLGGLICWMVTFVISWLLGESITNLIKQGEKKSVS